MSHFSLPDWLRIILAVLSCASFVPQLYVLVIRRGNTSGISLTYVLLNLIVATELFAISFFYTVNKVQRYDLFVHKPPNAGDWINLANFAVIWVLWLVIFLICLVPFGRENPWLATVAVVMVYAFVLWISLVPLVDDAFFHRYPNEPSDDWRWVDIMYHHVHALIITPVTTLLALPAFLVQARAILARPPGSGTGALSLQGLALQAVVFAVLAATWLPGRLVYPEPTGSIAWCWFLGLVPVDHALFALEQALLVAVAGWHRRRERSDEIGVSDETQPLIAS
ncbi:hypothetical protein F5Y14DRAFT_449324 [Nemania sp. NC0429]|nr:hypothetical protein F5Y14DRAFT_449324 [Nemania sp. NC0429]